MTRLRIFSLLLISLLVGCFTLRDYSSSNLSSMYRVNEKSYHPEFIAYNESDSTIRLFVKLLPSEFLFARQTDGSFKASVKIHSDIIFSYEDAAVIDTSSQTFSFDLSEKELIRIAEVIIPARADTNIVIRCTVKDMTKGNYDHFFIPVNRSAKPSRQDFLLSDTKGRPLYRNFLNSNDTFSVIFHSPGVEQFICKYYNREFPLAPPPFNFDAHSDFNYTPDSLFYLTRDEMLRLNFPMQGFYHIQTDSSNKDGLTLFRFSQGFPDVTTPRQMIESARYLINKKEFEEMKAGVNPKSLIDNFWLTHGGNEEKSRLLIKKYYGRVREANRFFTSHTEGWRTDRGMIYVIFGSPGTVYRSNESESWIYGTPNSSLALNFFFIKVNNPFTENDFTLSRSPMYESSWYRAVEVWRQGRPYNSFY